MVTYRESRRLRLQSQSVILLAHVCRCIPRLAIGVKQFAQHMSVVSPHCTHPQITNLNQMDPSTLTDTKIRD